MGSHGSPLAFPLPRRLASTISTEAWAPRVSGMSLESPKSVAELFPCKRNGPNAIKKVSGPRAPPECGAARMERVLSRCPSPRSPLSPLPARLRSFFLRERIGRERESEFHGDSEVLAAARHTAREMEYNVYRQARGESESTRDGIVAFYRRLARHRPTSVYILAISFAYARDSSDCYRLLRYHAGELQRMRYRRCSRILSRA